ncbi:DUF2884 family protein [Vibrio sp. dsl-7]|uniref:DUF2884 family protein n=1 Tax=Vibrio chanodichtyis TaxID=3027932 RepID=A0ABT5V3I9_9VIBR|nr:DUF2884 family protein [Vibrio chanodichtyis]MDE1514875.1 DUF2884 family protein [Vibrio chanodichtyis]
MKKIMLFLALLISPATWAAQCRVDIQHEVHVNSQRIAILRSSHDQAVLDQQNHLAIQGKKINLTAEQQAALADYRVQLTRLQPKAQHWADQALVQANQWVDEIANSLDAPQAFDNVKQAMASLWVEMQAEYLKDGELVVPAATFDAMQQRWQQQFAQARVVLSQQLFASAFTVMASHMQQEGGLDLNQLSKKMADLKGKLDTELKASHSSFAQQAGEWCETLNQLTLQEQQLHQKIPQLKGYQIFSL